MKNRNFTIVISVLATFCVFLILFVLLGFLGFRVINNSTLLIDWDATNGIINGFLVVITGTSIVSAIFFSEKARIEVSKIDLFSQRFELYYALLRKLTNGNLPKELEGDEANEFDKTLTKLKFLVNDVDRIELNKISTKPSPSMEYQGFDREANSHQFKITLNIDAVKILNDIFKKYIDIGDYGITNQ